MKTAPQRAPGIPFLFAFVLGIFFLLEPSPSFAANTNDPGAAPRATHTWHLAKGGEIDAALVAYSMQSRMLTLRTQTGSTAYVGPRELTAVSKLRWLTSPIFFEALRSYRFPQGAGLHATQILFAPTFILLLGLFLCFWIGTGMVTGEKRFAVAAMSFGWSVLWVVGLSIALAFSLHSISVALGDSPIAPAIGTATIAVFAVGTAVILSGRVASDYSESGVTGAGAVAASGAIALVFAVIALYAVPRVLGQPGIDDWFTDRLLVPLGLA